eukprot:13526780-Alexandrium_andersonii.AAC.1
MSTRGFQKTQCRHPTRRIPKFEETGTQEARNTYSLNVIKRFHGALSQGHEAVVPPDSASSRRGEHQVAVSVAVGREVLFATHATRRYSIAANHAVFPCGRPWLPPRAQLA